MSVLEEDMVVHVNKDEVEICQCLAEGLVPCGNIAVGYKTFKWKKRVDGGGVVVRKFRACQEHKDE